MNGYTKKGNQMRQFMWVLKGKERNRWRGNSFYSFVISVCSQTLLTHSNKYSNKQGRAQYSFTLLQLSAPKNLFIILFIHCKWSKDGITLYVRMYVTGRKRCIKYIHIFTSLVHCTITVCASVCLSVKFSTIIITREFKFGTMAHGLWFTVDQVYFK